MLPLLLLSCGGKVEVEKHDAPPPTRSPPYTGPKTPRPIDGTPSKDAGTSSADQGTPSQTFFTTGTGYSVAYTNVEVDLDVKENQYATFNTLGRLTSTDAFKLVPPYDDYMHNWFGAGITQVQGADVFYAIGRTMTSLPSTWGMKDASFAPSHTEGTSAGEGLAMVTSASCSFVDNVCTVTVSSRLIVPTIVNFTGPLEGTLLRIDDGKSRLRAALTCTEDCAKGDLQSFGLVIAYEFVDTTEKALYHGASALPYGK